VWNTFAKVKAIQILNHDTLNKDEYDIRLLVIDDDNHYHFLVQEQQVKIRKLVEFKEMQDLDAKIKAYQEENDGEFPYESCLYGQNSLIAPMVD
jgi:hypothetical protein